jgi:hypothetical protein
MAGADSNEPWVLLLLYPAVDSGLDWDPGHSPFREVLKGGLTLPLNIKSCI